MTTTKVTTVLAVMVVGLLCLISTMMMIEVDGFQAATVNVGRTTVSSSPHQQHQHRCPSCQYSSPTDSDSSSDNEQNDAVITPPKPAIKCPDCDLCDGSGRISGGIGAVLDWWPIKAYRPCPNFIERGGMYSRSGQGLDEIAFGRDSKFKQK
mmetsp:Transcript_48561/g.117469  ORF Transcript_48561/g.117469 Transcript_48561/m.117469 type:complete len:152 (-) Transcript_48561:226-681(-)